MAGVVLNVIPKRVFDFTNFAVGSTPSYTVVQRIDVSQYTDGVLEVRFHVNNIPGGNTVSVNIFGDGYTDEDPASQFTTLTPLFAGLSVSGPQQAFIGTSGGTVYGHYAVIVVSATMASAITTAVTLSADLVLRSPDDSL